MAPDQIRTRCLTRSREAVSEYSPLQSEIKQLIKSSGRCRLALHGAVPVASPTRLLTVSPRSAGTRRAISSPARSEPGCSANCSVVGGHRYGRRSVSHHCLRLIGTRTRPRHHDGGCARALRVLPPLYQALSVHLVEINPALARKAEGRAVGRACHRLATTASTRCPGSRGHFRQRIFRRPADPQMVNHTGWHERTSNSTATASWRSVSLAEPTPRFEVLLPPLVRAAPAARCSNGVRRRDHEDRDPRPRSAGPRRLIIDYGHVAATPAIPSSHWPATASPTPEKPRLADVTAMSIFRRWCAPPRISARVPMGPCPRANF